MPLVDPVVALLIASPHILYACIWFKPEIWRGWFGGKSVEVFAKVATAGKVIQFTSAGAWYLLHRDARIPLSAARVPYATWIPALLFIFAGQVLNVAIYRAIGKAGVYYGFKLGKKVPWHTGFPFNVGISHPQYVGSVMTVWGIGALLWSQAPPGFAALLVYWTVLYVLTGLQEHYL